MSYCFASSISRTIRFSTSCRAPPFWFTVDRFELTPGAQGPNSISPRGRPSSVKHQFRPASTRMALKPRSLRPATHFSRSPYGSSGRANVTQLQIQEQMAILGGRCAGTPTGRLGVFATSGAPFVSASAPRKAAPPAARAIAPAPAAARNPRRVTA